PTSRRSRATGMGQLETQRAWVVARSWAPGSFQPAMPRLSPPPSNTSAATTEARTPLVHRLEAHRPVHVDRDEPVHQLVVGLALATQRAQLVAGHLPDRDRGDLAHLPQAGGHLTVMSFDKALITRRPPQWQLGSKATPEH